MVFPEPTVPLTQNTTVLCIFELQAKQKYNDLQFSTDFHLYFSHWMFSKSSFMFPYDFFMLATWANGTDVIYFYYEKGKLSNCFSRASDQTPLIYKRLRFSRTELLYKVLAHLLGRRNWLNSSSLCWLGRNTNNLMNSHSALSKRQEQQTTFNMNPLIILLKVMVWHILMSHSKYEGSKSYFSYSLCNQNKFHRISWQMK